MKLPIMTFATTKEKFMLEVNIYNDIATNKEQIWMSAFGFDDCIFSADVVKRVLRENPDEKDIKFNIHCDGGSVSEGLTIYDILRNSGRNLYMNIEGSCHSMAVVLLLAAPSENRSGNTNLRALVHRVYAPLYGYYTADELKEMEQSIVREENAILDIYEERTGKNRAALKAWMKAEKERTSDELLNMNFISKINTYNTNFNRMNKNQKPAAASKGSNGKTNASKLLEKAAAFLNKSAKLLNPALANYDYKDGEGSTVFSTSSEEDTLAVGDTVEITDGGTEGTFTLDDGRVVSVVDNTVTEITEEEPQNTNEAEVEELRNALAEANGIITELRNQIESNYTPQQRTVTKQTPSNAKKTVEELKAEATAKRNAFKNRKPQTT